VCCWESSNLKDFFLRRSWVWSNLVCFWESLRTARGLSGDCQWPVGFDQSRKHPTVKPKHEKHFFEFGVELVISRTWFSFVVDFWFAQNLYCMSFEWIGGAIARQNPKSGHRTKAKQSVLRLIWNERHQKPFRIANRPFDALRLSKLPPQESRERESRKTKYGNQGLPMLCSTSFAKQKKRKT